MFNFLRRQDKLKYVWACLRLALGWIFVWSFFDKLFGFGLTTSPDKAWLDGVSPTTGFLKFATKGPFSDIFQNLAGSALVDWLFMLGLLFIGLGLISGIAVKLSCYAGSLMLFLMWLAVLPPAHNPLVDEHLIYIVVLIGLYRTNSGHGSSLGKWWVGLDVVKKFPILK